jgi:hypothetical protein
VADHPPPVDDLTSGLEVLRVIADGETPLGAVRPPLLPDEARAILDALAEPPTVEGTVAVPAWLVGWDEAGLAVEHLVVRHPTDGWVVYDEAVGPSTWPDAATLDAYIDRWQAEIDADPREDGPEPRAAIAGNRRIADIIRTHSKGTP